MVSICTQAISPGVQSCTICDISRSSSPNVCLLRRRIRQLRPCSRGLRSRGIVGTILRRSHCQFGFAFSMFGSTQAAHHSEQVEAVLLGMTPTMVAVRKGPGPPKANLTMRYGVEIGAEALYEGETSSTILLLCPTEPLSRGITPLHPKLVKSHINYKLPQHLRKRTELRS